MNSSTNLFDLKNKTVILTGSAGRLGSRFAEVLSNVGANVVLVDIDEQKNSKLEKSLVKKFHTKPMLSTTDISNQDQVRKMVKNTLKKYGGIDVLINNAHFLPRDDPRIDTSFEKYPLDLWEESMQKNMIGLFLCCQEVGKVMKKQSKGVILNVSSIYGIQGSDQRIYGNSKLNTPSFYALTKGGMVNFTRYLAAYWNRKGIRVNTLTLGGVRDDKLQNKNFIQKYSQKTMIGRMANKEDYDGAILFLCSNASSYMTGSNLVIDGGWSAW